MMSCLSDLLLAIVVAVSETVSLPSAYVHKFKLKAFLYEDGYFILVADGFFHGRNAVFDFFCVATYCGLIHANCVIVIVQFAWRYQLICQSE